MSSSVLVTAERSAGLLVRAGWYVELTKPRIASLVLVTVAVAAFVGNWGPPSPWLLWHTLIGTALVAGSASALNQWAERHSDQRMPRTADRPLPSGRLTSREVLVFGTSLIVTGTLYLAWTVNLSTAALGLLTWFLYVFAYTPLKSVAPINTAVGAVAGAMPVLMGWSAVEGSFELSGGGLTVATLFLIVYLWQFPHFMAIAWIYRRQYQSAGLRMLTVVDPSGMRAGVQAVVASLALLPVSLLPLLLLAGRSYGVGAMLLGIAYFAASCMFLSRRDDRSARRLLRVSLVYLPALLGLFVLAPLT